MGLFLRKAVEQRLYTQQIGTGVLVLKTAAHTLMQVDVFIRPTDGILCRLADSMPALPSEFSQRKEP